MSHVDEGRMHAWLDGELPGGDAEARAIEAHIESCRECRTRMVLARADHEAAGEILALAVPDPMETPPFDEIAARGGAAFGTGSPRRAPWLPLGWAASVVLAVVGGWSAHAAFDSGPGARPASFVQDEPSPAAMEVAVGGGADLTVDDVTVSEEVDATAIESATADVAATEPTSEAGTPQTDPAMRPTDVAARTTDADRATAETVPARTGAPPEPAVAPPMPTAAAEARTFQDRGRAQPLTGAMVERTTGSLGALADRAAADGLWRPVSPAEAAEALGRPAADLAGLPWSRMELAEVDGEAIVRTTHPTDGQAGNRTDDADPIELLQRRAVETPGVVLRIEGIEILLRGARDAEAEAEFLRRVRGESPS